MALNILQMRGQGCVHDVGREQAQIKKGGKGTEEGRVVASGERCCDDRPAGIPCTGIQLYKTLQQLRATARDRGAGLPVSIAGTGTCSSAILEYEI